MSGGREVGLNPTVTGFRAVLVRVWVVVVATVVVVVVVVLGAIVGMKGALEHTLKVILRQRYIKNKGVAFSCKHKAST